MRKLKKIDGFCAPFALKYVSKLDDETVYAVCKLHDFTPEFGMEEHEWTEAAEELGIGLERVNLKKTGFYRSRLRKFINWHKKGVYFIYTDGHLFLIENGKVVDQLNPGYLGLDRLVTGAWRVIQNRKK